MKNLPLIATIIGLIALIYLLMKQSKIITLQTTLLMGIAQKLQVPIPDVTGSYESAEEKELKKKFLQNETTSVEEDDDETIISEMTRISDLIKNKSILVSEDEAYYNRYFDEMHEDLQLADPKGMIVATVTPSKSATQKDTTSSSQPDKKRYTDEEKASILLTFFNDNNAKSMKQIALLLSQATGTKPNEGNAHGILETLIKEKKIKKQEIKLSRKKMFYGLFDWFDGKEMKPDYLKNIA